MAFSISITQGNLLNEENATFIVNASNTRLLLGSGVSMAFKHHCGIALQKEMNLKLEEIGKLYKGDVVATSSGNAANFKYALHAAIMDYNQGVKHTDKNPSLDDIKEVLENILLYLEWYENKSTDQMKLVLPLLGCGVGGLNTIDVVKVYKDFFSNDVSFDCEVVVYGYTEKDYEIACEIPKNDIDMTLTQL